MMRLSFLKKEQIKRLNFWDVIIVSFLACFVVLFGYSVYAKATKPPARPITIVATAGNLENEVAHNVNAGDMILDRDGRAFFRIQRIDELRPAKQAVVRWDGQMVSADNPEEWSVKFTATSVNPKFKGTNLFYNWELVKPGRLFYMETQKTGFFATILSVSEEK